MSFLSRAISNDIGDVSPRIANEATVNGVHSALGYFPEVDVVVNSLKGVGVKFVYDIKTTVLKNSVFDWIKEIHVNDVNPLRCDVLIQSRGYEAFTPSAELISLAEQHTGDLQDQIVYLLRTNDEFFLTHKDKIIAYKPCRS